MEKKENWTNRANKQGLEVKREVLEEIAEKILPYTQKENDKFNSDTNYPVVEKIWQKTHFLWDDDKNNLTNIRNRANLLLTEDKVDPITLSAKDVTFFVNTVKDIAHALERLNPGAGHKGDDEEKRAGANHSNNLCTIVSVITDNIILPTMERGVTQRI